MNLPFFLIFLSVIIFICILLNDFSSKIGLPYLLAFIILGMIFGSDGILKIEFDNFEISQTICSIALIFIMFYGGFGTNWRMAKKTAKQSITLASLGVVFTALLTGLFAYYILKIPLIESMILGSVLASTDFASVFSILKSKRLNLKYGTASILEIESGSNDPTSYMLTILFISIFKGNFSLNNIALLLFKQIFFGLGFGFLISYLAENFLKKYSSKGDGLTTILVFGIALISFGLPEYFKGNGYLSTYIVGIYLGNLNFKGKKELVSFFDGVTGICQMLIFFLLGLLSFPSKFISVLNIAVPVAIFLFLVARVIVIYVFGKLFKMPLNQILIISCAGLRGASSIVFAMMVVTSITLNIDIFHIVFVVVLFSILFQGSLIPTISNKLNMIDDKEDVTHTFNLYSEEIPVEFIRVDVPKNHPWCDKQIKEIILPPTTLIVKIERGQNKILPKGKTIIQENDSLILVGFTAVNHAKINISRVEVAKDSEYINSKLRDIQMKKGLIIMLERNNKFLIPNGNTSIKLNDKLIIQSD